jgi:hypothetical protein
MPTNGMNVADYRAGDNRLITGLAQRYVNDEFVGKYISPFAPVLDRLGSIARFDDTLFEQFADDRAPGSMYNQIETGYTGVPYKLLNKGLTFPVPVEFQEEAARVSIDLGMIAQNALSNAEALNIEIEQRNLVATAGNYAGGSTVTLSGTSQFSDAASNPGLTVRTAMSAAAQLVGKRPNVILAGAQVTDTLMSNPDIQKRYYPTSSGVIDDAKLADYFGVQKYVTGRAVWRNPATRNIEYIWGKSMILAYVDPRALASGTVNYGTVENSTDRMTMASAFYSYVLKGHPIISNPYWEESRDTWFYKIKWERGHFATLPGAAYLIQAAVA